MIKLICDLHNLGIQLKFEKLNILKQKRITVSVMSFQFNKIELKR